MLVYAHLSCIGQYAGDRKRQCGPSDCVCSGELEEGTARKETPPAFVRQPIMHVRQLKPQPSFTGKSFTSPRYVLVLALAGGRRAAAQVGRVCDYEHLVAHIHLSQNKQACLGAQTKVSRGPSTSAQHKRGSSVRPRKPCPASSDLKKAWQKYHHVVTVAGRLRRRIFVLSF